MSRVHRKHEGRRRARLGAWLASAAAAGVIMACAVQAQDGAGLRGPVSGDAGSLLDGPAPTEPDILAMPPPEAEPAAATVRQPKVESEADNPLDEGAQRSGAIEGLDRRQEDEPFAPLGIRMGTFILKPTLEQGITATTNADGSSSGESAVVSETTLRLNAESDWSSHKATVDAYGVFRRSISGDEVETSEGGVDGLVELELGKDYRARAELGLTLRPESATSPVAIVGAASQPLRRTVTGSLGLEKDEGKARLAVTGSFENEHFDDAELEGGGVLSQADRASTLYTLELRAGYEVSPALTPFVETEIGRRLYDLELDSAGYARSSDRLGLRAGLAFDLGEKLSGEFSAGWIEEDFDDPRLETISGLTLDGDVEWSPVRGTTVGLTGSTTVEGATDIGESGSILYSGNLSLMREMRANLTGTAALGAGWRDYLGCTCYDRILSGEASLTWWLNRSAGLTGRLRHEDLKSNVPDRDASTSSVFVGLKLQR